MQNIHPWKKIDRWKAFNYLQSIVTSNGKCDEDIKKGITLAKALFTKMTNIVGIVGHFQ